MIKVLIVGSNPSEASIDDTPFREEVRSTQTLFNWISSIHVNNLDFFYTNVVEEKMSINKINNKLIESNLNRIKDDIGRIKPDKVIALGNIAEKALSMINVKHLKLPHPSGRNRQLNDKNFVDDMLLKFKEYLLN